MTTGACVRWGWHFCVAKLCVFSTFYTPTNTTNTARKMFIILPTGVWVSWGRIFVLLIFSSQDFKVFVSGGLKLRENTKLATQKCDPQLTYAPVGKMMKVFLTGFFVLFLWYKTSRKHKISNTKIPPQLTLAPVGKMMINLCLCISKLPI